jgi:predicted O-methyltransferase YrrM
MDRTAIATFEMTHGAMRPFLGILYSLARYSDTGNILEIGVREAQSTKVILGGLNDRKRGMLTSVDIRDYTRFVPEDMRQKWRHIVGNSHDSDTVAKAAEHAPYDFIMIDGDHTTEGVEQDWLNYGPLCKKGGLVLFHDISNDERGTGGVEKFWKSLDIPNKVSIPRWPGLGIIEV